MTRAVAQAAFDAVQQANAKKRQELIDRANARKKEEADAEDCLDRVFKELDSFHDLKFVRAGNRWLLVSCGDCPRAWAGHHDAYPGHIEYQVGTSSLVVSAPPSFESQFPRHLGELLAQDADTDGPPD